jgi:hypothetical protein
MMLKRKRLRDMDMGMDTGMGMGMDTGMDTVMVLMAFKMNAKKTGGCV